MKIQLENNLYLESDEHQFILREYTGNFTVNKAGEEVETYRNLGYYGTIQHAIKGIINKRLLKSSAISLQELRNEVSNIEELIERKINF